MKRNHLLFLASLALNAALGGSSALWAQEQLLTLNPPLSEAFPFETLTDGVHVEYPVLLNDHTVLRPEAVLHFIFLDPNAVSHGGGGADDGGTGVHSHIGPGGKLSDGNGDDGRDRDVNGGRAGGWGSSDGNDVAGIYDDGKNDTKHRKEELQNEIWRQKELFDDALEHATELGTMLVYALPAQTRTFTAGIDLPEGMLLGEVNGHVRVLGLKEESRAFVGGVRPGDEIRAFNSGVELKSLADFMREFIATKHEAKRTGNSSYSMQVWRPANSQSITVQVAAPPTIPSFLNDIDSAPKEPNP